MKRLLALCVALVAPYAPQVYAQWRDVCPEYLQCANRPHETPPPPIALSNGRYLVTYTAAPALPLDGQSLVGHAEVGADGSFRSVDVPGLWGSLTIRGSTWMAVTSGGVTRSFDDGQTWQTSSLWPGGPQIDFVNGMYYPAGPSGAPIIVNDTVYVGYDSIYGFRIYTSRDAGQTWTSIKNGNLTYATLLAGEDEMHVRAYTGSDLYETVDEGATWQKLNVAPLPARVHTFYRDPPASGALYAATDDGVLRSTDGGHTFAPFALVGRAVYAIERSARGVFYAGVKGGVMRSTDGGASWQNWSAGLYPVEHTLAVNGDQVLVGSSMGYFRCAADASCVGEPRRVNFSDPGFDPLVREFYNSDLDHYFITGDADEAASVLDGRAGPGWSETGDRFYVYPPLNGVWTRQVCRFYGSPTVGPNSHFFTASMPECDALRAQQSTTPDGTPRWNDEGIVFAAVMPSIVTGVCPSIATDPVYRLYNNGRAKGIDPNHRYTTSAQERDRMVALGWIYEGIAFCGSKPK